MAPFLTNGSTKPPSNSGASCHNPGQQAGSALLQKVGVDQDKIEPIAIIGFSARFPQDAISPEAFWNMLREGRSAMTEIPKDRFNIDSFYHSDAGRYDRLNVRGGHFLQGDLAAFDAPFFSIPRAEAVSMDPQQRGLLEESYKALENAGVTVEDAAGSKTGVFVGTFAKEYDALFSRDPEFQPKYQASGTGSAMLANRLSWFYDFKGPSIPLDTACSSSLIALHLACLSLRNRESTMGLVAGCNVMLNPDTISIPLSNLSFLSPDARCYSFDHRANGYSRGEGFGVVLIKLLSDALRDGNTIRAVIRGTGSNQDGRTPGITQPSRIAQEILIRDTYVSAGLDLRTTQFFEAHGTGTPIGDPTEAGAISAVFKTQRPSTEPLLIGAVKSNIGHLEGASGLASLIKTIMVLEKGIIPPNIWFERPNPSIPVEDWNIKFPLNNTPWPTEGLRRASVNSFGYGGANAHIILEDAYHYMRIRAIRGRHCSVESPPTFEPSNLSQGRNCLSPNGYQDDVEHGLKPGTSIPRLIIWTAADEAGLKRVATALHNYLCGSAIRSGISHHRFFDNLAYTLTSKRSLLPWKSHLVCETVEELIRNLEGNLPRPIRSSGTAPALGFVFTGQGAQWYAMGRELFAYLVFKKSLEGADRFLRTLGCHWSLIEELYRDKKLSNIHSPEYAQPLCTALQVALVDLLASWNIRPFAVIGHSSGEIAAAYCVGGLSRESAWKVAYYRGVLASRLTESNHKSHGSMMAVALSEQEIQQYLSQVTWKGEIAVGCVNSPTNVTVTGTEAAIRCLKEVMDRERIFARTLQVSVAYHSVQMNQVAEEYLSLIHDIGVPKSSAHQTLMYSSVTGDQISADLLSRGEYWVANMVSKVVFSDALAQMCKPKGTSRRPVGYEDTKVVDYLVEIGPHSALQRPIKDTMGQIGYISALKKDVSASQTLVDLAGHLCCLGCPVDLLAVHGLPERSDVEMLTDLPPYSFNHSQTYWHESRISKNFRFRKHPPHELLGTPTSDWNPLEAKWRHTIRRTENPWVKDHKFNGSELYPAAGMIVMAIEAARQVANSNGVKSIRSYRFKDVTFVKALVLSMADEAVETQFYLRPRKADGTTSSIWNDFRLCMLSNNEWVENCRGTIIVEYDEADAEVDAGFEAQELKKLYRNAYKSATQECSSRVDSKQMYENLDAFGFGFGPTFQSLGNISYSESGKATATIQLRDWVNKIPEDAKNVQKHVIHPTTLDGVFHLTVVAITRGGWTPIPTMVPTHLENLWISNDILTKPSLDAITVSSNSVSHGYREADFDILALNPDTYEPLIVVDQYRATAVTSLAEHSSAESEWRRLCYSIEWKPDVDTLSRERLSTLCNTAVTSAETYPVERIDEAEMVCLYFISEALAAFPASERIASGSNLDRYLEWMNYQYHQHAATAILSSSEGNRFMHDKTHREIILDSLEKSGPEGKMYVTIGRNLIYILNGEVDALDLLVKEQLLQDFYSSSSFVANYQKIRAYVDLLAHKDPNRSILEIGAGTGGATAPILQTLGVQTQQDSHGTPRYDSYTYTDISPGFFEEAKGRFSSHIDRLVFKSLDIEKDPVQQGFEAGKYDLVVASCVLHATTSINVTLKHTRKLLKPGGKLILFEPCNLDCSRLSFVFGLLPGWWLADESHRRWGPLLSDESWHNVLLKHDFSGTDICLRDYDGDRHTFSVMASTALTSISDSSMAVTVIIVVITGSLLQQEVANELQTQIQSTGRAICQVISVQEIRCQNCERAFCIFLPEIEDAFLNGIQHDNFADLKHLMIAAREVIWVTCDGGYETQKPEMGLVTGFGRSMCSEIGNLKFITVALEYAALAIQTANKIFQIYRSTSTDLQGGQETEYMEKGGGLCISRVIEANTMNDQIFSALVPRAPEMRQFGQQPERALTLTISSPGLLDTLHFVDDIVDGSLGPEEVEVSVRAVGVNFKNVMVALGQLPDKSLGQECAGIVTQVGVNVDLSQVTVGERVCCITHGAFKTYARSHASSVHRIPDSMAFSTAAALPVAFCTAYYSLHHLGRLRQGESLLIHAAAGGVGQAAIQLASLIGAIIYVTVGSNDKKRLLMDLYNIPSQHVFSSRNLSFAQGIRRVTNGRGVDVVLNSLAGESLRQSFECVAPLGRFVEIGKKDMYLRENLPMSPFLQNITFASVDLGVIAEQARPLMAGLMKAIMELATARPALVHSPKPLHIFRVSEVESAFRFLQSGKNGGKTVIEIHDDDMVSTVPSTEPSWYFDENATYVISGGLGGLGRSIARWMGTRNAKHLVLLSRSGARGEAALTLLRELEGKGIEVIAPSCDISDESALVAALEQFPKRLPPIKGCIQASMVLKDGLFENMELENFNAALRPKVQGSWNLHAHLPKGMDFFVLLSSTGGVFGSRGQSNYAAGNTYQDSFARYRLSLGEKAISLNLGLMLAVGFAAERQQVTDSLRAAGYEGIYQAEFFAMLDHFCNPKLPLCSASESQIVTGISTPALLKSKGMAEIFWMSKPLFRGLSQMDRVSSSNAETLRPSVDGKALLEVADSLKSAGDIIAHALSKKLSSALSMPENDIEVQKPIFAYGVDSLVAVEIRYWFLKEFKAEVAVFNILESESISKLSVFAAEKSGYVQASLKVDGMQ